MRPGGGTPGNSCWGCTSRFSKSWTYIRPKNAISLTLFQTRPLKSIPVFRTGLQAEIMSSLLSLGRKQKNSWNAFRIHIFLFRSYLLGIERINTFIHSRSSLENQPNSRPKWAKSIPVFRSKRPKNPTLGVGERTTIERIERLCTARDVYGYIRLS